MQGSFFLVELIGFLFVCVMGPLAHFAYQASGKNRIVGLFTPINESTWEHLKLLFFPMLLYSLVECFFSGRNESNFIPATAIGLVLGGLTIVTLFYTYVGIIGKNYLWMDILTFIIGAAVAFAFRYWAVANQVPLSELFSIIIPAIIICFFVFTIHPLHIGLFFDPVTKTYGIQQ